jgi:hypothetical protein
MRLNIICMPFLLISSSYLTVVIVLASYVPLSRIELLALARIACRHCQFPFLHAALVLLSFLPSLFSSLSSNAHVNLQLLFELTGIRPMSAAPSRVSSVVIEGATPTSSTIVHGFILAGHLARTIPKLIATP